MQSRLLSRTVFFLLTAALLVACATSPTGRRQLMLVSPQEAVLASKQAYVHMLAPLEKEGKIDSDPELTARVRRITNRLVAVAVKRFPQTRNWEWSVKVIDDPKTVNAWCMAGGRMAVYTGLIEQVKPTDDELAQVMGHEIAHAVANHTAEKMSVALATMLGVTAVGAASGEEHRDTALAGAALAAKLAVELPNSRTAEAEADRIGIELAARAGYDPRAAISLWRKMARLGGSRPPEFLSTHPAPEHRSRALQALVPKMLPLYEAARKKPSPAS